MEELQEKVAEMQLQWLRDNGATFADILADEDGEFIFSESDTGHPSDEGYAVNVHKIYLPDFEKELTK